MSSVSPCYHKQLPIDNAIIELKMVRRADEIDPDQQYHIGKPVLNDKDKEFLANPQDHDELITIKYPHGGDSLDTYKPNHIDLEFFHDLAPILKGLSILNSHGILHLDVKISNMVRHSETGFIKLIDFGISQDDMEYPNILFKNIYPIWPFEVHMLTGTWFSNRGTDSVYKSYIADHYFREIIRINKINDITIIKHNIDKLLNLSLKDRIAVIYSKIDVYSMGLAIGYLLDGANISTDLHNNLSGLVKKMICFDTMERITLDDAYLEYLQILRP